MPTSNRVALLRAATALSAFASLPALASPTFLVNSTADLVDDNPADGVCHTSAGTCTLRAAVMQSNAIAEQGPTIQLPAGTFTLTRSVSGADGDDEGDLNLTAPATPSGAVTTIVGAGAQATIIDANHIDRAFAVAAGRAATISRITIRNGAVLNSISIPGNGGCISNEGALEIAAVAVTGCSSELSGGGISTFYGALSIADSTIAGNRAGGGGGGVIGNGGSLTVTGSAITSNFASSGGGVAVFNDGAVTIVNSTIAYNGADFGGGVFQPQQNIGSVVLYHVTVVGNFSPISQTETYGAAGISPSAFAPFDVYNSLIAGNIDQYDRTDNDCDGPFRTHQENLLGVAPVCDDYGCYPSGIEGCAITEVNGHYGQLNAIGTLGNLADNGGPTATIALLAGSNAIDYGDPVTGCQGPDGALLTDQRGYARPAGATCDVGAYEFGAVNPNDGIFADGFN